MLLIALSSSPSSSSSSSSSSLSQSSQGSFPIRPPASHPCRSHLPPSTYLDDIIMHISIYVRIYSCSFLHPPAPVRNPPPPAPAAAIVDAPDAMMLGWAGCGRSSVNQYTPVLAVCV
eukprot:GHVU01162958.1.p3 GENE.GHVU01162958.1~~GHVU01162958.1.p3  ORF type:complete len:117 (+),score=13.23 GHVU01162958.1:105-455(+)